MSERDDQFSAAKDDIKTAIQKAFNKVCANDRHALLRDIIEEILEPYTPKREMREIITGSEKHVVSTDTDPATGIILSEEWHNDSGEMDRADGPAAIERDPTTGTVTHEFWWKNDHAHRADGAAFILRDPETGIVTREKWFRDNKQHRDGGPAYIERDPVTGTVTYEEWWKDGEPIAAPSANANPAPAP